MAGGDSERDDRDEGGRQDQIRPRNGANGRGEGGAETHGSCS